MWCLSYADDVELPAIDTDVMRFKFENISTSTTSEGLVYSHSSDLCPTPSEHEGVNWQMVGKGIALSMGQGIAIQHVICNQIYNFIKIHCIYL